MILQHLWRDTRAAGAAEFGLLLPLLILLLFGIIDAGRFMWIFNQAEKATQQGARVAVVTRVIPQGLADFKYVGQTVGGVTYTQGDTIQASALGKIECKISGGALGCTCATAPCPPDLGVANASGFNAVVARMQAMYAPITPDKVVVEYRGSGVGYAGDPSGMDVSPLVTVRLEALQFTPLVALMLKSFSMPDFASTLTAEDSVGNVSY